jgi:hypothetical protein
MDQVNECLKAALGLAGAWRVIGYLRDTGDGLVTARHSDFCHPPPILIYSSKVNVPRLPLLCRPFGNV